MYVFRAGTPPRVRPAWKTNACRLALVFVSAAAGADHPLRRFPTPGYTSRLASCLLLMRCTDCNMHAPSAAFAACCKYIHSCQHAN